MTTRKPPRMSVSDWVELQIRNAERSGAFENLPGAGKPIPGLGQPQDGLPFRAKRVPVEPTVEQWRTRRAALVEVRAAAAAAELPEPALSRRRWLRGRR